jgi:hypothetical protein
MITLDDLVAQARDLPESGTSERGTVRLEREEDVFGPCSTSARTTAESGSGWWFVVRTSASWSALRC